MEVLTNDTSPLVLGVVPDLLLGGAATASRYKLADLFVHQRTQSDIVMQQSLIVKAFVTWRVFVSSNLTTCCHRLQDVTGRVPQLHITLHQWWP
jgi:hypothetical protein